MPARHTPANGPKPDKLWRDALHRALKRDIIDAETGKRTKALELLADKVVMMALDGDAFAINEVATRMDGRIAAVAHADADSGMVVIVDTGISRDVSAVAQPSPKQIADGKADGRG